MQHILIMDLASDGHHPRYIQWILGSEACRGAEVVIAGRRELLDHTELSDVLGGFKRHVVTLSSQRLKIIGDASSTAALVLRQFVVRKIWHETYSEIRRKQRVDLVILPWADDCLDAIALLGSPFGKTRWTGIVFRPMFHFRQVGVQSPVPRFSSARQWLFRRVLRERHLAGLFTIDPTLFEFAGTQFSALERPKLSYLPDPAVGHKLPSQKVARAALGIPSDARVILLYGALSQRKGVGPLIGSAADAGCPRNVHILLAGKQSQDVRQLLESTSSALLREQNRLHLIDGYQTDAGEANLLAASDCVWVGYREFYTMSGILLLAARHGLPCLVSNAGLGAHFMKKYDFGLSVDPDDNRTIIAALRRVSTHQQELAVAGERGKAAFRRHSVTEFQSEISMMISNALGD